MGVSGVGCPDFCGEKTCAVKVADFAQPNCSIFLIGQLGYWVKLLNSPKAV